MKQKRIIIWLGVALSVCASIALVATRSTSAATTQTQTGKVSIATISSVIESAGSVSPQSEVTLAFNASGTVNKVNVQVGDQVKQGEVLAELDPIDLELAVAQAQQSYLSQQASYSLTIEPDPAAVTSAQLAFSNAAAAYQLAQQKYVVNGTDQVAVSCNNLDSAQQTYHDAVTAYNNYISNWRVTVNGTADLSPQKAQLDRAQANYAQALSNCNQAKSSVSASGVKAAYASLLQAKANLDSLINPTELALATAKAQLDQAKSALDQAQQALADAKIIAPFDGVVTAVSPVVGGSSSGTITLANTQQYHVDVLVDETEIAQLKVGQKVAVTFDALSNVTASGVVSHIDPAGTISNGVVNYSVRVNLDPVQAALRTDMTANVSITIDTHPNVLAVPGSAVRSDSAGYYVNVLDASGLAQRIDVTTGYTSGDLTEVVGDLQAGQEILISEPTAQQQQQPGLNLFGLRLGG